MSTYVYAISSLSCSVSLLSSTLLTQSEYDLTINPSLLLFDDDNYDANNHYCCLLRDKKYNNNNATNAYKDQIKSIDSIEEVCNYLEFYSSSLPKGIAHGKYNNNDTMTD